MTSSINQDSEMQPRPAPSAPNLGTFPLQEIAKVVKNIAFRKISHHPDAHILLKSYVESIPQIMGHTLLCNHFVYFSVSNFFDLLALIDKRTSSSVVI